MGQPRAELLQGTLDLLILRTLSRGPMHGWGVSQRIGELSQDVLKVHQGSLYPALYRLQRRGWVASEWGASDNNRRARFYRLTPSGQRRLETERENWERMRGAVARILQTT